jgi:hypothetical protein
MVEHHNPTAQFFCRFRSKRSQALNVRQGLTLGLHHFQLSALFVNGYECLVGERIRESAHRYRIVRSQLKLSAQDLDFLLNCHLETTGPLGSGDLPLTLIYNGGRDLTSIRKAPSSKSSDAHS